MAEKDEFDLVIVGAGPAGLTAAIYALRSGLKTACIEKNVAGGEVVMIENIENYPGFSGISGMDLMKKFSEQAKSLGLKITRAEAISISDCGKTKAVKTNKGEFSAKAVIVAAGSSPKPLGIPGEKELKGRGVHYCALCDGPMYAKKNVFVVGGGNSAVEEAVFLSRIASKVVLVHRRGKLRADSILQERALKIKNIEWLLDTEIMELAGKGKLEKIVVENNKTGKKSELRADALFVYVGRKPNTGFVDVKKSETGLIAVDSGMRTSVAGIFAAGDCIEKRAWQIAACVGEGAVAAISAREYIDSLASE